MGGNNKTRKKERKKEKKKINPNKEITLKRANERDVEWRGEYGGGREPGEQWTNRISPEGEAESANITQHD